MDFNEKLNYLKGIGYNPGVGATRNHPQTVNVHVPSDIPTLGFQRSDLDEYHRANPILA